MSAIPSGSGPADSPRTTEFLLARHHEGDRRALDELVQRELPSIRAQVHQQLHGIVREYMDTGDVVQEVCLSVLQKGPRFVVAGADEFRRLMARIIRNKLVSMARYHTAARRGNDQRFDRESVLYLQSDAPRVHTATPSEHAARNEERDLIALALELIDPLDREVLLLRDEVDVSFVDIGGRLGMEPDAVRMRYRRGLKKLERCVSRLRQQNLATLLDELDQDGTEPAA